jgi:hypothetical protein
MMWQTRRIPVHAAHLPQFMGASALSPFGYGKRSIAAPRRGGELVFRIDH